MADKSYIDELVDNQKFQGLVARGLGVKDESDFAIKVANDWARTNKHEDSAEDTLRHILLGGLMQSIPGEGIGRIGKGIAGKLVDLREGKDKESLIDTANNNFGKLLRQQLIDKEDTSIESFVGAAKNAVNSLLKNKKIEVEGLSPKLSTAGGLNPGALGGRINNFQKGGTNMANTEELYDDVGAQMELSGLVSEPTDRDPVSGNEIPLGATAEGVRDDQTAAISAGEFVIPDYAVRYHGLDFYVDSLQAAQSGLQQMEGMGLVGNPDEQTIPDEAPLPTMPPPEEQPQTEFQTGGIASTELYRPTQQDTAATTTRSLIDPIRPISTQPTPIAPSIPLDPQTPQLLTQYQQGYYREVSPGWFQLFGPPGVSVAQQVLRRDQLPADAVIAPSNTTYEQVFGPRIGAEFGKIGTAPSQSQYLQLQGQAAGLPGGYDVAPFINEQGNIIYLTTIGGKVQGGLPPGYRAATPEDLGLPSTTPTELVQKPPVIPPHLGGIGPGDVTPSVGPPPSDFRDVTEVMGYVPIGWSLGEVAKVGILSLMPFGSVLAGNFISKKKDQQKEQIKEQMKLQHKITTKLPKDFFMTDRELAALSPSLAQPGQAVGDTLSVDGQNFSIGYGKGKVDPSLAAAVASKGKGKISAAPSPAASAPALSSTFTGPVDLSGLPASIDLGPDPFAGNISGKAAAAAETAEWGPEFSAYNEGGLVSKKMKQKKGSKGLASV